MPIDASRIQDGLDWLIDNEAGAAFERLAVGLAMQEHPELIPTSPKSDLGADAISRSVLSSVHTGPRIAVAASLTATHEKIGADAKEINKNYGTIDLLEFYTPRQISQKKIMQIADSIRKDWRHDLIIHPRESLTQRLMADRSASLCVSFLRIAIPDPSLDEIEHLVLEAVRDQLSKRFAYFDEGVPLIELMLQDGSGRSWTHDQLVDLLEHGAAITLQGDPGGGKTTTLFQLATRMIDRDGARVPIYIDLPSWFLGGDDLVGYIQRQPAFLTAGLNATQIARFLTSGRCALLLNGWNEVKETRRESAHQALLDVRINFPTTALALATRPASDLPNVSTATYELRDVSYRQRNAYLRQRFEDTATQIINALESEIGLVQLARNPLLLDAVATSFESIGKLPRTRNDAIEASLSVMEQSADHAPALQQGAVKGGAIQFLIELAGHMTDHGTVIMAAHIATECAAAVIKDLAADGAITNVPEPGEVLDCLTSHYVLRRSDDGLGYVFSHQVYQEYYASEKLHRQIESIIGPDSVKQIELREFVATTLNQRNWSAALSSVVETLELKASDGDITSGSRLRLIIMCSSLIDPILSATLIRLTGDDTWGAIGVAWKHMPEAWSNLPPPHDLISLIAKIESGRLDFHREVWGALEASQHTTDALHLAPTGVSPHSLGPNWRDKARAWPENDRRNLLLVLGHSGWSSESIDAVMWFAEEDPSEDIKIEAISILLWNGAWQRASAIILQMSQSSAIRLLERGLIEESLLNAAAIDRLREFAVAGLQAGGSALDQLRLACVIRQQFGLDVLASVKETLATDGFTFRKEEAHRWRYHELEKWTLGYIKKEDPDWARQWILKAFTNRQLVGPLEDYLSYASNEELMHILDVATSISSTSRFRATSLFESLAALGSREIFSTALRAWRAVDGNSEKHNCLQDFLRSLGPSDLLSAIVDEFDDMSIEDVAPIRSLLGTSTAAERRRFEPDPNRETLLAKWRALFPAVKESVDFGGQIAADYANVLSCIGEVPDSAIIRTLIDKDIARRRTEVQLLSESRRSGSPPPNVSRMSQTSWMLGSLVRIAPDDAKVALVELLNESEYEEAAQESLIRLAIRPFLDERAGDHRNPPAWLSAWMFKNGRDYRLVNAEAQVAELLRPKLIREFERIKPGSAEPSEIYRLKNLYSSFGRVAGADDCEIVLEVMSWPADYDYFTRLNAVESLYSRGLRLSYEKLEKVFWGLWKKARDRHWLDDGDKQCLDCSMQALAFSDKPERAVPIWREFSTKFHGYERHDLILAILAAGFEGSLQIAHELDCAAHGNERSWSFIEGLFKYVDPQRAAPFLNRLVLGDDWRSLDEALSYHQQYDLGVLLSAQVESDTATRTALIEAAQNDPARRNWIAFILATAGENGLRAALELLDDEAEEPVPPRLWDAIRNKWLTEQTSHEGGHMITTWPQPANELRALLLSIAPEDASKRRSLLTLLGQIYCERLERGTPVGEDRHPDISRGCCWPLIDWNLDEALASIGAKLTN